MNDIVRIKKFESGAEALLKDALEEGFTDILLVGISKDGTVNIRTTYYDDTIRTIGCIEAAKDYVLRTWPNV
jgi:hypothetical protein